MIPAGFPRERPERGPFPSLERGQERIALAARFREVGGSESETFAPVSLERAGQSHGKTDVEPTVFDPEVVAGPAAKAEGGAFRTARVVHRRRMDLSGSISSTAWAGILSSPREPTRASPESQARAVDTVPTEGGGGQEAPSPQGQPDGIGAPRGGRVPSGASRLLHGPSPSAFGSDTGWANGDWHGRCLRDRRSSKRTSRGALPRAWLSRGPRELKPTHSGNRSARKEMLSGKIRHAA